MRVPSIEPLTSTTNTVATGRPPSFLSFQTFWTSISVAPDGTSTVGVNGAGSNPNSSATFLVLGLLGELGEQLQRLGSAAVQIADGVQRVVVSRPERDELVAGLQRVGVRERLPLHHERVERAGVVLDRVAHLQGGERHERHLALELFEHTGHVGRRQLRLVALGDRVEHGQQEVQTGARRERIGVAHHEVTGDHRVDEVLRGQLAVRRAQLVGGLVLHHDAGDVLDRTGRTSVIVWNSAAISIHSWFDGVKPSGVPRRGR